jgi:hypothetical protein
MTTQHINLADSLLQLYRAVQPHRGPEAMLTGPAAQLRGDSTDRCTAAANGLHSATQQEGPRAAVFTAEG